MSREYRSTKEIAAWVRETLKKELPQWKFSVQMERFSGGSAIDLSLMSGPEEVLEEVPYRDTTLRPASASLNHFPFIQTTRWNDWREKLHNNGYTLTPKGWEVMEKATKILATYHWDDSDIQSDYFCTNFYMHVHIGKWDRRYIVCEVNE